MATNRKYADGRSLSVTCTDPTTPASGGPVRIGGMTGVALTDERADGTTSVDFGPGVYTLSVKGVDDDANVAVAVGDKIYYVDADTPKLSKKVSGYFYGFALAAVSSGATTSIDVLIDPSPGAGTLDIAGEVVTLAKMADLARGSIIVGATAGNRPTALDANDSGKILVGDGTDLVSIAVSGDATLASTGALTIANDAITAAKIAGGAVGKTELASGFLKIALLVGADETMTPNYTLAAMAVGDEVIAVLVFTTAASIATLAQRADGDFTAGAGVLTTAANAANNTNNQLLVLWRDAA